MTECGSVPDNTFSLGVLNNLCSQFRWGEKEYAFASYLIDLGGPITFSPRTWLGKQNMQGLLFRDEERKYFDIIVSTTFDSNSICK